MLNVTPEEVDKKSVARSWRTVTKVTYQERPRCPVNVRPFPQSLWLVDDAIEDEQTGKITLRGIYDVLDIVAPATEYAEGTYLFFALRNIHEEVSLTLDYLDVGEDRSLLTMKFRVSAESPNETVSRSVRVNKIPVPHDGQYAWQLRWNDEVIAEAMIAAYIQPPKSK